MTDVSAILRRAAVISAAVAVVSLAAIVWLIGKADLQ